MNYLKNRYPFKLITNILRIYKKPFEFYEPHSTREIKRNKSDSAVFRKNDHEASESQSDRVKRLTNGLSKPTVSEWNIRSNHRTCFSHKSSKASLMSLDSCDSSLTKLSNKTSSSRGSLGGVLTKKDNSMNLQISLDKSSISESSSNEDKNVISDENGRSYSLKRSYPWQNFNLKNLKKEEKIEKQSISVVENSREEPPVTVSFKKSTKSTLKMYEPKKRNGGLKEIKINKTCTMSYPNAKYSVSRQPKINLCTSTKKDVIKKTNNVTTTTNKGICTGLSQKIHMINQSVINRHKSTNKVVMGNRRKKTADKKIKKSETEDTKCFGKYMPLKRKNSFLCLYNNANEHGKKQKLWPDRV